MPLASCVVDGGAGMPPPDDFFAILSSFDSEAMAFSGLAKLGPCLDISAPVAG